MLIFTLGSGVSNDNFGSVNRWTRPLVRQSRLVRKRSKPPSRGIRLRPRLLSSPLVSHNISVGSLLSLTPLPVRPLLIWWFSGGPSILNYISKPLYFMTIHARCIDEYLAGFLLNVITESICTRCIWNGIFKRKLLDGISKKIDITIQRIHFWMVINIFVKLIFFNGESHVSFTHQTYFN